MLGLRSGESGSVLTVVLVAIVIVAGLVVAMMTLSVSESKLSDRDREELEAFNVTESAVDVAAAAETGASKSSGARCVMQRRATTFRYGGSEVFFLVYRVL